LTDTIDMQSEEIEIKLILPPEQASSFRRSTLLRDHKSARAKTARLVSKYFDTPALTLRQNKVALRIREAGQMREQTFKWSRAESAGLQSRTEFNMPVTSDQPDLSVLELPELEELRLQPDDLKKVRPVFASHISRTTWLLDFNGSKIEVALDEGEIVSGKKSLPVSEIELELVSGKATDLVDLAILIAKRLDVCPATDSKAGRGYALFQDEKPSAAKVKSPDLTGKMPVRAAFQGFMQAGIKQLLANRSIILEGDDPEGVHQGRVAIRRMRAALSVFKPVLEEGSLSKAKLELRWMQQELGPARDWDVFLEETISPLKSRMPDDRSLKNLEKLARQKREQHYRQAWDFLNSRRFATSVLWFERWLLEIGEDDRCKESLPDFAAKLLNKRRKAARKKAGPDVTALPDTTLHELRIELKKLRYAASLFKSLYPKEKSRPYMDQLSVLQDCLGGLNDAAVQQHLFDELKEAETPADRRAQSIVAGWHAAHTLAGLDHLEALWRDFSAVEPFWR